MKSLRFLCVFTLLLINTPIKSYDEFNTNNEFHTNDFSSRTDLADKEAEASVDGTINTAAQEESTPVKAQESTDGQAIETEKSTQPSYLQLLGSSFDTTYKNIVWSYSTCKNILWQKNGQPEEIDTTAADKLTTEDLKPVVKEMCSLLRKIETTHLEKLVDFEKIKQEIDQLELQLKTAYKKAQDKLTTKHNSELDVLKTAKSNRTTKLSNDKTTETKRFEACIQRLLNKYTQAIDNETKNFDKKINEAKATYNQEVKDHNKSIVNLSPREQASAVNKLQSVTDTYEQNVQIWENDKKAALESLKTEYNNSVTDKTNEHTNTLQELQRSFDADIKILEIQENQKKTDQENEIAIFNSESQDIQNFYITIVNLFKNKLQDTLKNLQADHLETLASREFDETYHADTQTFFGGLLINTTSEYTYQAHENGMKCKGCIQTKNDSINNRFVKNADAKTAAVTALMIFAIKDEKQPDGTELNIGIQTCTKNGDAIACKTKQKEFKNILETRRLTVEKTDSQQ